MSRDTALFIPGEVEGMIPNGWRVEKVNDEEGDAHKEGDLATVMSSIEAGDARGYFVSWHDNPGVPVFVAASRIRKSKSTIGEVMVCDVGVENPYT